MCELAFECVSLCLKCGAKCVFVSDGVCLGKCVCVYVCVFKCGCSATDKHLDLSLMSVD